MLTQAREDLILRTFDALHGAKQATVHLYNATAPLFRRLVFGMEKAQIVELATRSTRLIRKLCEENRRRAGSMSIPRNLLFYRTRIRTGDLRSRGRNLAAVR